MHPKLASFICFHLLFRFFFFEIGKFRREFVSVLDRCRCSHHDVHSRHSFYLNAQAARLNTISPNTRSMYHYTSQRDRHKSFREKQVRNISVITCSDDVASNSIDNNQFFLFAFMIWMELIYISNRRLDTSNVVCGKCMWYLYRQHWWK